MREQDLSLPTYTLSAMLASPNTTFITLLPLSSKSLKWELKGLGRMLQVGSSHQHTHFLLLSILFLTLFADKCPPFLSASPRIIPYPSVYFFHKTTLRTAVTWVLPFFSHTSSLLHFICTDLIPYLDNYSSLAPSWCSTHYPGAQFKLRHWYPHLAWALP